VIGIVGQVIADRLDRLNDRCHNQWIVVRKERLDAGQIVADALLAGANQSPIIAEERDFLSGRQSGGKRSLVGEDAGRVLGTEVAISVGVEEDVWRTTGNRKRVRWLIEEET